MSQAPQQPHPPAPAPVKPFVSHVAWRKKLVVVLVGLPARGKSYVATKLVTWQRWRGARAELFNVGKFRRSHADAPGAAPAPTEDKSAPPMQHSASFFSPDNAAAAHERDQLAFAVLDSMLAWLGEGGDMAVLDATNTTRRRRAEVLRRIEAVSPVLPVCFIESICDNEAVLQRNFLAKVDNSPDYRDMDRQVALADLMQRIANYERVYEPLDEGPVREDVSYIKLINLASKCICNRIHGTLMHSISSFLMSIHVQPRPIYLSRAGRCINIANESSAEAAVSTPAPAPSSSPDASPVVPSSSFASSSTSSSHPTLPSDPVHTTYAQDEDVSLNENGRQFASLMNEFVGDRVLEYWHRHLVSKRMDNLAADAGAQDPDDDDEDEHRELSLNALAAATVFSPPVSAPTSPVIAGAEGGTDPGPFPDLPSATAAATTRGRCGSVALSERSSAVIGSGSMLLTLERSATTDTLPLVVYTSTLPRALQTVCEISERALYVQQQSSLNALDHGTLSGLTVDQIKERHPARYAEWQAQRYRFRFPGGESAQDKARSLESFMNELERQLFPVLIVSHASTLQILLGYFSNLHSDDYSRLRIPQHHLIELTPTALGWTERRYDFSDGTRFPRLVPPEEDGCFTHAKNFYAS